MGSAVTDKVETKRWKESQPDIRSRYSYDDRISYSDGTTIIETHDSVSIPQDNSDKFYLVQAGYENRLDLISWMFYDTAQYWWIIAYASNIFDPFNVPAGTLLRIPLLNRALREVNNGKGQP